MKLSGKALVSEAGTVTNSDEHVGEKLELAVITMI